MAGGNRIGITLGDPAGVGPEVAARAIGAMPAAARARTVVIGPAAAFERAAALIGLPAGLIDEIVLVPVAAGLVPDGRISAEGGDAAFRSVKAAVDMALAGEIGCIVTAPLNKAALHAAGHEYDGHTGLITHLTGRKSAFMLLAAETLNTIHTSTHISLEEATRRASKERVLAVIEAARAHFLGLGKADPRIAVAGLNPHCGEGGIFGRQEIETIGPAIEAAKARGWAVHGPISGDTVFHRAHRGEFDVVVAQYHDQGHIPIKLLHFDTAVNVTLGLPVKRTSVDHGTAFDIAWKGVADATNMGCAIAYAFRMLDRGAAPQAQ